jgi:hypothetical protein
MTSILHARHCPQCWGYAWVKQTQVLSTSSSRVAQHMLFLPLLMYLLPEMLIQSFLCSSQDQRLSIKHWAYCCYEVNKGLSLKISAFLSSKHDALSSNPSATKNNQYWLSTLLVSEPCWWEWNVCCSSLQTWQWLGPQQSLKCRWLILPIFLPSFLSFISSYFLAVLGPELRV